MNDKQKDPVECCECCDRPVDRCGEREPYHEDADHWEPDFEDC